MGFFEPPSWVPKLVDPPDSISIQQFMQDESYGRVPFKDSKDPFTCGISGRTFSYAQQLERTDALARALSDELGWAVNRGSEWDKVMGVFALNTIEYMTLSYAVHRLSGIVSPANATYSTAELEFQLKSAGAKALFTCIPLLETSLQAAKAAGIPEKHVYILDLPKELTGGKTVPFKNIEQLVAHGRKLKELEPLKWTKGQGTRQTAFLCYSSGTSGLPKGVMISHRNVIANTLQITAFESIDRAGKGLGGKPRVDVALGLLPQSHIYGLVVVCASATYRGDQVIILPKFEIASFLGAIEKFKITTLFLVPPIIIQMVNNEKLLKKRDLSSVHSIFTGAAPLGPETATTLQVQHPSWKIRQGYGLTETSTVICVSAEHDICFGTCGSLVPGTRVKLVTPEGVEITKHNEPGELFVQSPSVVLGYLKNDKANKETFIPDTDGRGRWMRTGDEAEIRKAPSGYEHVVITDRIKELIKVKGLQVAPAELESHILSHPAVADCTVIGIHDDAAGERPKAFVVKSTSVGLEENDKIIARDIAKHVENHKARHKWLKEVEFVDVIPKSPSGKILRRLLRDQEKAKKKKQGARL